jgi:gamma-glutamyltranspeptidase / glutathione hydrolase
MVASQAQSAAHAGVAVLEAGGNAVDAAVAAALALAAVEPWNSGLGGIGFALIHRAGQPVADIVDFGPVAPRKLDPSLFRLTGRMKQDLFAWPEVEDDANIHGPLSFVIPAAVAGYELMHRSWGRLPLADVAFPAISLAKRGLPQDWFTTLKIAFSAPVLRKYEESARIYLPNGLPRNPPYQGEPEFFRLGRLAETLEQLTRAGLRDQYDGEVAAQIAADVASLGGVLSIDDLKNCQARTSKAVPFKWHGHEIQMAGGLTASPTMQRVLEQMAEVTGTTAPDAAWFVAFADSLKRAYAERLSGLGDTDAKPEETCTTHITTCDSEGTMVALTTTLLSSMGSRVVLPRTGILMNNGVMWFDPRPGQPNSVSGGKRPLTNMSPVILRRDGRPWLAAGASGGRRIVASVLQMMMFVAEFGMDIEAAAHHPRIDVSDPDLVSVDARMPPDIIHALQNAGTTKVVEHGVMPINFACPNIIAIGSDCVRSGISDVQSPWSAALAQSR